MGSVKGGPKFRDTPGISPIGVRDETVQFIPLWVQVFSRRVFKLSLTHYSFGNDTIILPYW